MSELSKMQVYLVGLRWPQHAKVSGYDAISRFVGVPLKLPIINRWPWKNSSDERITPWYRYWLTEKVSNKLEQFTKVTYSLPLLKMELSVGLHMIFHRKAIYHVLYGETDIFFLGKFGKWTGNLVVASFHDGEDVLKGCEIDAHILNTLDGIVLLGEKQKSYFEQYIPSSKIWIIPHGVDCTFFYPRLQSSISSNIERPIILTVGGHTRDHATLDRAIDLIAEEIPNVRFIAVSANVGNKGPRLQNTRVEHMSGLSDKALLELYQEATVAVFSFEFAIANNSVLEALACGLPVVATNIGAVSEYINLEAGILVPPHDERALAQSLIRIIQNPQMRSSMSQSARSAANSFDLSVTCETLVKFYTSVYLKHK